MAHEPNRTGGAQAFVVYSAKERLHGVEVPRLANDGYGERMSQENHKMKDPTWMKAIFLRDPKERLLSAYLDKVVREPEYIRRVHGRDPASFPEFADFVEEITTKGFSDAHWASQTDHLGDKWWPYINFVGRVSHAKEDAEALLKQVGAWEKYGASGWGRDGSERMFATNNAVHFTGSSRKVADFYTPALEKQVADFYAPDYARYDFFNDPTHPLHRKTV